MPCIATFLLVALSSVAAESQKVRITTWNLEWFPNGSAKDAAPEKQEERIQAAAKILRKLHPDILLLQEVRDYEACARLGEAIEPNTYKVAICSNFKGGRQQEAILAKTDAQAAWTEPWKSMEGIDPPRGFAFAYFKVGNTEVGAYALHLKSNLVTGNNPTEVAKNIRKRELAVSQLLDHINNFIGATIPSIKRFVVGGDFNTNHDQTMFASEKTLDSLTSGGYRNVFEGMPFAQRITHPGSGRYPNATFDYIFGKNIQLGKPAIVPTDASDHFPVTCDVEL